MQNYDNLYFLVLHNLKISLHDSHIWFYFNFFKQKRDWIFTSHFKDLGLKQISLLHNYRNNKAFSLIHYRCLSNWTNNNYGGYWVR
jgi:hypothetical protein